MAQRNPYAPSSASLKAGEPHRDDAGEGVWREGKDLIMNVSAALPRRCVKCNAPADEPTKTRKLYWHHPALYLLVFLYMLVYIIVALIVRKKIAVEPGLCRTHKDRRRNVIIGACVGMLAAFIVPIALAGFFPDNPWLVLVGVLMFFGSAIYGLVVARIVYARRIDADEARLGGCGEAFLESLSPPG